MIINILLATFRGWFLHYYVNPYYSHGDYQDMDSNELIRRDTELCTCIFNSHTRVGVTNCNLITIIERDVCTSSSTSSILVKDAHN